jgi:hypothetical protein
MLHFIDDVAASHKSLMPVSRAHAHPHRHLANGQIANAMHARGVLNAELRYSLRDDALAFFDRKRLERLIFQMPDGLPSNAAYPPQTGSLISARKASTEIGVRVK